MEWMLQLGKDGYSGEYTLPLDEEVQATTNICEVDVYRESSGLFFLPWLRHFLCSQAAEMLLSIIYQKINTFVLR